MQIIDAYSEEYQEPKEGGIPLSYLLHCPVLP